MKIEDDCVEKGQCDMMIDQQMMAAMTLLQQPSCYQGSPAASV